VIIALNETSNFTANGDLYIDDHTKKGTYYKLIRYKFEQAK
jgi:hypothetical protein